jgi:hypothetical protein
VRLRNRAEDAPQKLSVWGRTFKHNLSQQEFGPTATTRIGDVIAFQSEQFPDLSGKRAIRIRQAARVFFRGGYQAGRPAVVVQRSARLHKRQFYLSRFAVRSSRSGSCVEPYSFSPGLDSQYLPLSWTIAESAKQLHLIGQSHGARNYCCGASAEKLLFCLPDG